MKKEQLFETIGSTDSTLLARSEHKSKKKNLWPKWSVAAACLVLVTAVSILFLHSQAQKIPLSDSCEKVRVTYIDKAPAVKTSPSLVSLTEEELFTEFNTDIFSGTVTKLDNIKINYNDEKEYRAVAEIKIEKVFRGGCEPGKTVTVLLPCPINTGIWVGDTDTVSAMKTGMHGIYMAMPYDEESFIEQNGARLALKDLADYGFPDGSRYAFLETDDGLVFSKWAYTSIADAKTLAQIEAYIVKMVEQNK